MKYFKYKICKKQEKKLTSISRSFYTLVGRFRGCIVGTELSDF